MDRSDIPWPEWMLRYVATDTPETMEDLIWSVGGSPPYGGVSYEEASAVYELLEGFMGPAAAPASAYESVLRFAGDRQDARTALEIFRCYDQIVSSSSSFSEKPVERGLELSARAGHNGAQATFLAFLSNLAYRGGDVDTARDATLEALERFLELATEDPAYKHRITATNAISFTALAGNLEEARRLLLQLGDFLDDDTVQSLSRSLMQAE